jgi:hypothetical protein
MEQASQPLASSLPSPLQYYQALVASHIIGWIILVAGLAPYFRKINIIDSPLMLIGSVYGVVWLLIPLVAMIMSNVRRRSGRPPKFLPSLKTFRIIAVIFTWIDLLLLCWTILLTGGLTGSMYIPVFLAIPACLFLLNQELDPWEIKNLIFLLILIGVSYWMVSLLDSHIINQHKNAYLDCHDLPFYDWYMLFRASDDPRLFMWSKRWVNTLCILAPFFQCMILFLQRNNKKVSS